MTLRSKLPFFLIQKYFHLIDQLKSIYSKIEVITDSNAIVNSVRIMIVMLALLMGYIHTPTDNSDILEPNKTTQVIQKDTVGLSDVNK